MDAVTTTAIAHRRFHSGFKRHLMLFTALVTVGFELLTLAVRFGSGVSAVEFNKTAPLLMQIHHMFWSVPLFLVAPLTYRRWPRVTGVMVGTAVGFILSDLIHHFIVLPILVGNTGWHWP